MSDSTALRMAGLPVEAILDAMSDGVWICDAETTLIYVNDACQKLNDIRSDEVLGRTVKDLLKSGNFDQSVTNLVLKTRQPAAITQKVKSSRTLLVHGTPVFDAAGRLTHVVGMERDLTELVLLRSELERSQITIEHMRSDILALKRGEHDLAGFIAESPEMERTLEMAFRVAEFGTTVLLSGPTGSGKSLLAKIIHRSSARRDKPFIALNCGAIAENLLEAELFGYASGAFTGASQKGKIGLIEAATDGTLFLDEIDSLPRDMQVKLLTFLDTQSFFRVGDTRPRQVDVRLIAATNQDLKQRVGAGQFREDLFFRLNVVPIAIPPLNRRRADIPALVAHIVQAINDKHRTRASVHPLTLELLMAYSFPGNVRELQNILERAVVFSAGGAILPVHLPPDIHALSPRPAASPGSGAGQRPHPARDLAAILDGTEAEILKAACRHASRQSDLAAELGVSQPTVARLLKKHGLVLGGEKR